MPENLSKKQTHSARPFTRRIDVLVVAALLVCAGVWLFFSLGRSSGAVAQVSVTTGSVSRSFEVPLSRDDIIHIEADYPVTLEVKDGAIRFVDSRCPDHLCEGFGWLRREGDWGLCAPAGVLVSIHE